MTRDFDQAAWDDALAAHVASRAPEWLAEDLGHECDWTTLATVPAAATASLAVVARRDGVIAGLPAAAIVERAVAQAMSFVAALAEGARVERGAAVATLSGPTRSILTAERTVLNLLGRTCGVATGTARLVEAVAGTRCRVYDTRKTVPGWRLLDKYAVRVGGGWNHRHGLHDAVLIKDNHRAALAERGTDAAGAVRLAREFLATTLPPERVARMVVEIEIDRLEDLEPVLAEGPDVVLLDNMQHGDLAAAVAVRDRLGADVALEASGGIRPETIHAVAATGVDRISSGWPTHDAPWLDVALDW
ncbi:MAG: carboxylating nicotinate-nucleotide diphosphorylase [Planctomycetota bacterium]